MSITSLQIISSWLECVCVCVCVGAPPYSCFDLAHMYSALREAIYVLEVIGVVSWMRGVESDL